MEARDCIVTEIKSIAGIIVAQRSYPDPGCELPEPPEPPEPPEEDGTQKLHGIEQAIVLISGLRDNYYFEESTATQHRYINNRTAKTVPTVKDVKAALSSPLIATNYSFLTDVKIEGYDRSVGDFFHKFPDSYSSGRRGDLSYSSFPTINRAIIAETSARSRVNDEWHPEAAKNYIAPHDTHYVLVDSQLTIKSFIKNFNYSDNHTIEKTDSFRYDDGTCFIRVTRAIERLKVEQVIPLKPGILKLKLFYL